MQTYLNRLTQLSQVNPGHSGHSPKETPTMQTTAAATLFHRVQTTTLALLVLAVLAAIPVEAATLYWDANGGTGGTGGTGNWNKTDNVWRDSSISGTLQSWVDNNNVNLGGTSGTLTLTEDIIVGENNTSTLIVPTVAYTIDNMEASTTSGKTLTLDATGATGTALFRAAFQGGGLVTINAPVVLAGAIGTKMHGVRSPLTINGDVSETDAGRGFYITDNRTLTLTGNNTFTGGVNVATGKLIIGHDNAAGTGTITWQNSTRLEAANGSQTVANAISFLNNPNVEFTGANNLTFSTGAKYFPVANSVGAKFTVTDPAATLTFASLTELLHYGDGPFEKLGAGTLAITGDFGNGDNITVSAGTLLLNGNTFDTVWNGTQGQKNYTVASGAALGGNGTINLAALQAVTVNAGGTLAPGASVGTLTVNGDVNLGGTLAIEIDGDGSADLLDVNGLLDMDLTTSVLKISFIDSYLPSATQTWTIFDLTGMTVNGGFSSFDLEIAGSGFSWNTDNLFIDGTITTKIPEPASIALLGLAALTVIRRRQG